MNRFTEQFHTRANEIRMTSAERRRVHDALMIAMQETRAPIVSPYSIMSRWYVRPLAVAAAYVFIMVVLGGTAYAAEGALPGDALYLIKVGAIEPLGGALAVTDEAKVRWNAEVATARLGEAEALAERGDLTPATSAELAANFSAHAAALTAAANRIAALNPASASTISAQFSSSVASKSAAILSAGKKSKNQNTIHATGNLVVAVASSESNNDTGDTTTSVLRASAPVSAKVQVDSTTVEALSLRAHTALAAATSTIARASLSNAIAAGARAHAAAIANQIVKADAELSIGSTSEAESDFTAALKAIDRLNASVQAEDGLNEKMPSLPTSDTIPLSL